MSHDDRRESIAALVGNMGYQALLKELEETINDTLVTLSTAKTEEQVVRFGRLYQVFFKYWHILKTTPETLRDELKKEQNDAAQDNALNDYLKTGF